MTRKYLLGFWSAVFVVVGVAMPASADQTEDLVTQIKTLTSRVDSLERENAVQKNELSEFKAKPNPSAGNFVKSKGEIELYGQVKTDLVFSSGDAGGNGVNSTLQTNASRPSVSDDPETQFSAQDTRLGLNLKAPDLFNGGKLSGKVEFDFFGGSTVGTYTPRLRLAYADLSFQKWSLRAGQDWDFVAPLMPNLVNPGYLFRSGNIGVRHAQITLTNKWGEALGGVVTTKVGALDSDDSVQEDSGLPVLGAYAQYDKTVYGIKSTLGVGGLYGRFNTIGKGLGSEELAATTVSLTLKLTDWLSFKSEGFVGKGLNKFSGGPAQTLDSRTGEANRKPIEVKGGFAELSYIPVNNVEANFGIGIDDVKDNSAYSNADKSALWDVNKTYYTNVKYSLSKDILVALEYQTFNTKWFDKQKADAHRVQTTFLYKF